MTDRELAPPVNRICPLIGRGLLVTSVAASALAIGTVHTTVLAALVTALAVSVLLICWNTEFTGQRTSATLLLLTGVGLTCYTVIQALPLPFSWLKAIAPYNADVWARALQPLAQPPPAWATISLDPTATHVEVLRGVAYLLAFVAALQVAKTRRGVSLLSATLILTGAALAVSALLHPAFGAHKVFGLYAPVEAGSLRHVAPLLNPNHLGAYLNIAFCLTFGAAISREPRVPRPILIGVACSLAGVQLWVASRGAVGAMFVGVAAAGATTAAGRSVKGIWRRTSIGSAVAIFVAVAVMALAATDDAWNELHDGDVSKLALQRFVIRMVRAVPLFGVGRGAFASTFPRFLEHAGYVQAAYPENILGQWASEWGIPVSAAAIAAILYALRPRTLLPRVNRASGAWAALCAVAVHNLVDFSSEIPGVMLAAVTSAAIVVGGTTVPEPSASRAEFARPAALRAVWRRAAVAIPTVLASAFAIATALGGVHHELLPERNAFHVLAAGGETSRAVVYSAARAGILRHPAEPYIPFAVALWESRQPIPHALPWAAAALERAASYAPAHLVVARSVRSRAPAQARLEYRTAVEQDFYLLGDVLTEAAPLVSGYAGALELLPNTTQASDAIIVLGDLLRTRLPATTVRLEEEAAPSRTMKPRFMTEAARRLAERLEQDVVAGPASPWCGFEPRECAARALSAADAFVHLAPTELRAQLLRAHVVAQSSDLRTAVAELLEACDAVDQRTECFRSAVDLARSGRDEASVSAALERLLRAGCGSSEECVASYWFVGNTETSRGHLGLAVAAYKLAIEAAPDRDDLVERLADALSAPPFEMHSDARDLYRRLAAKDPAKWEPAVNRETLAVLRATLMP